MRDLPRYHHVVPAAHRRLLGAVSATVLIFAMLGVLPASADERISIISERVLFGEEGSVQTLAEADVEPDQVGQLCTLEVHVENQFSVHPGNDILITASGAQTVIEDIEAQPDGDRDLTAQIVLGPTLLVQLRFGPHQVSSMGFEISVDCSTDGAPVIVGSSCPDPGATTSTTAASSSTTAGTPSSGGSTTTDCPEASTTTLPSEVTVPTTSIPAPCPGSDDASLSLNEDGCPEPTVLPTVIENTTTTAPPTTAPPTTAPPTTAAPTTTAPPPSTAAAPATTGAAQVTTTVVPVPEVLGLQIFRGLPQTPAASAVQAQPDYTG